MMTDDDDYQSSDDQALDWRVRSQKSTVQFRLRAVDSRQIDDDRGDINTNAHLRWLRTIFSILSFHMV
jgi:hypothetical protein